MKNRLLTVSTAALIMGAGTAFANGNQAFIDQVGGSNTALIQQTGDDNDVGRNNLKVIQNSTEGQGHEIDVLQSGDRNRVGTIDFSGIWGGINGSGFWQRSQGGNSGNKASVIQSTNDNQVRSIGQQTGNGVTRGHRLEIVQGGGDGNRINSALQSTRTSSANTPNPFSGSNRNGNTADITQTGTDNLIDEISQRGIVNIADVNIVGNDNGKSGLTGVAAVTGVQNSSILQTGRNNRINFEIDNGDDNRFGITQIGDDNRATGPGIVISGDANQFGLFQNGLSNRVSVAEIQGNGNIVGISQDGTSNLASLEIVGAGSDDNRISITQFGTNDAFVNVEGDGNEFDVWQNDDSNRVDVDILGDRNGATGGFSGDARTIEIAATPLMTEGLIWQNGLSNRVDLDIVGSDNLFAMVQNGDHNRVVGITTGHDNQAAIWQAGISNVTNYSQTGNGNVLGVMQ